MLKKGAHTTLADVDRKLKLYKEKFTKEKFIEKIEEKRKSWEIDLKALIKGKLPDFGSIKKDIIDNMDSLVKG